MLDETNDRELLIITDTDYCHHRVKDVLLGREEYWTLRDRRTILPSGALSEDITRIQAYKVLVRAGAANSVPHCVAIYNSFDAAKAAMQRIVETLECGGRRVELPCDGKMAYYELPYAYALAAPISIT